MLPTWSSVGGLAAFAWLADLGLPTPTTPWFVEVAIDVVGVADDHVFDEQVDTRFHLNIYSEEWGLYFCHAGRISWIRVTDIVFAHAQRDDLGLLPSVTTLREIGGLLRALEVACGTHFAFDRAHVVTDLGAGAQATVARWLAAL